MFVAGADEVGRGCFAGPMVAGCVVFTADLARDTFGTSDTSDTPRIDDSKKLTTRQREVAEKWIKENALTWGIGEASVSEINRFGISKATSSAFRRAVANANIRLHARIDYLLIDAFFVPYVAGLPSIRKVKKNGRIKKYNHKNTRQLAIVNGDSKSASIAAASIIAKVYRDCLMQKIGTRKAYKKYGWGENKGYGTKAHREAILKYGICRYHRKMFVRKYVKNTDRKSQYGYTDKC